jgi:N-acetyl-anhydromuramyl-L-alanine amidase AmpD
MDANGARELSKRLEAQEHWRQAAAVVRGEQPATDPDAPELEELQDGLRRYGAETQRRTHDGRPALITHRLCKRLRDGRWDTAYEVEQVQYLDEAAAGSR